MKMKLQVVTGLMLLMACAFCTRSHQEADADEWKEMDAFHRVMAEVFHPLKDSGNVQPAMERMDELADEAEKWAAAPLPERVNNDEVKQKLDRLKNDTRALADAIKAGAPEDQVGTTLYEIHDLFHEITEAWHKEGEHEHH